MGVTRQSIKGQRMQIVNLGRLEADVMLFGGPYSNLQATRAARAWAANRGISSNRVICTGDVAAYCANPAETLAEIRDWGIPVVAGNCEKQMAAGASTCGCGFDSGTTCDVLSASWFAHASARIGPSERAWMSNCPDLLQFELGQRRFVVVHGGFTDVSRFLWPNSPDTEFQEEVDAIRRCVGPMDGIIAGHAGIAFERSIDSVEWINAGAIGMPAHSGRPTTEFVTLTVKGDVTVHTLEYDNIEAAAAMRAAGLTQGYDRALISGWWPSEDVLPESLRRQSCANG